MQKISPRFGDLRERFHRIEAREIKQNIFTFCLERHPDGWTSLQKFSFNVDTRELSEPLEEIIALYVTADSLVRRDLDNYFESTGISEFQHLKNVEEVEKLAQQLSIEFLHNIEMTWDAPPEVLCSNQEIQHKWEQVRREAIETYCDAFVERVSQEWRRRHG